MADDSNYTVVLGLWGSNAVETEDIKIGQTVIAVKNAQVSEYAGRSLNSSLSHASKVYKEPNVQRNRDILIWWSCLDEDSRAELRHVSRACPLDTNSNVEEVLEHKMFLQQV